MTYKIQMRKKILSVVINTIEDFVCVCVCIKSCKGSRREQALLWKREKGNVLAVQYILMRCVT